LGRACASHRRAARNACGAAARARQRGSVAIIAGLALAVMIGFAGLVLDLGRLYVNKTELQSAADACALAASRELICDAGSVGTCPSQYLLNAEVAGIFAAARNSKDMQASAVVVSAADVRFSTAIGPNAGYASRTTANPNAKFAMCIARSTGIVPWFMGVMGLSAANDVAAAAVATLAPSQNFCQGPPIGVCKKTGSSAPNFGYAVGEWVASDFHTNGNHEILDGAFKWIDFTPNAGGNAEIRDALVGAGGKCDIQVGNDVQQPGTQQGAKSAYNTRFGLYPNGANAYTPDDAPPDHTGYAYPNQAPGSPVIGIGTSAYADHATRAAAFTPFISAQYGVSGPGGNISGNGINAATHQAKGATRRLVNVPVIECTAGNVVRIQGMACVLMLNPMAAGASGTIYLEYRGPSTADGSPCPASGSPGGPGASGPMVPTLVQ
jgi:Flp pilus assembly protein TadG